jgi:hypothetical protein
MKTHRKPKVEDHGGASPAVFLLCAIGGGSFSAALAANPYLT